MRVRTSVRTGWPTAAHISRTWRLRPSWITSRSHVWPSRAVVPVRRRVDLHRRGRRPAPLDLDAAPQRSQRLGADGAPMTSAQYSFSIS